MCFADQEIKLNPIALGPERLAFAVASILKVCMIGSTVLYTALMS